MSEVPLYSPACGMRGADRQKGREGEKERARERERGREGEIERGRERERVGEGECVRES